MKKMWEQMHRTLLKIWDKHHIVGKICILFVFCSLLFSVVGSFADDTSLRMGTVAGTVIPIDSKNIRMLKAKIRVQMDWSESKVYCLFTFKNEGKDTVVLMGFPKRKYLFDFGMEGPYPMDAFYTPSNGNRGVLWDGSDKKYRYKQIVYDINDFTVKFDSSVVIPKILNSGWSGPNDSLIDLITEYYVWEVPFKKGEIKELEHCYISLNSGEVTTFRQALWRKFEYILSTGSAWKGTIGVVDFKAYGLTTRYPNCWDELSNFGYGLFYEYNYKYLFREAYVWGNQGYDYIDFLHGFSPQGYSLHNGTVSWNFKDIEPDFDISITLHSWMDEVKLSKLVIDYLNNSRYGKELFSISGQTSSLREKAMYGSHELYLFEEREDILSNMVEGKWINPYCLYKFTSWELMTLRLRLYALKGYKFRTKYFSKMAEEFDWYEQTAKIGTIKLTKCDRFNIFEIKRAERIIRKYEKIQSNIEEERN